MNSYDWEKSSQIHSFIACFNSFIFIQRVLPLSFMWESGKLKFNYKEILI